MSRNPGLTRDDLSEEGRRVYDEIVATRGEVDEAFQILLPRPELLRRIAHLGTYIRFESSLPAPIRECIVLATAREIESEFEWASHEPQARRAGVSDETIRAIKAGEMPSAASQGEWAAVRFVYESLRHHRVTDGTFRALVDAFGLEGATEAAATLGFYSMLGNILIAFDVGRQAQGGG
jgi:4-carboxymuconolactone decarboxylase